MQFTDFLWFKTECVVYRFVLCSETHIWIPVYRLFPHTDGDRPFTEVVSFSINVLKMILAVERVFFEMKRNLNKHRYQFFFGCRCYWGRRLSSAELVLSNFACRVRRHFFRWALFCPTNSSCILAACKGEKNSLENDFSGIISFTPQSLFCGLWTENGSCWAGCFLAPWMWAISPNFWMG